VKQFPIGFWNYVSLADQGTAAVKDWSDLGMTLAMSPSYQSEGGEIAKMRSILDAAGERDIKVILCDDHLTFGHLAAVGEPAYRDRVRKALAGCGDHPSVLGFSAGDEPLTHTFAPACRAMRIQKDMAPHLKPFCNLLPWSEGWPQMCDHRLEVGYSDWSAYLDAFVKEAGPEILCYDCYCQLLPGTEGWDNYFANLRYYSDAARRANIPLWVTLLSTGHFRYRCPKEDDFRWQINTAVAHGVKGILWFFVYGRKKHDNYRAAPIDEHGRRSETFEWLSRSNLTFLKSTASVVMDLTLARVSHVGRAWGGVPLFDGGSLVASATSRFDTPLIISEFKHTSGADYVMVVNNSQTESTHAIIWVRGRMPTLHRVDWLGTEELAKPPPTATPRPGVGPLVNAATAGMWLAPGQMELFRVENPA
jgi:hypothetical protein